MGTCQTADDIDASVETNDMEQTQNIEPQETNETDSHFDAMQLEINEECLIHGYIHQNAANISNDIVNLIASFYFHSTIIYVIGLNQSGCFGDDKIGQNTNRKLIELDWSLNKNILHIHHGNGFRFYETFNGKFYVAGTNRDGQCMQRRNIKDIRHILRLKLDKIIITKIFISRCSWTGFLIDENDKIYSFGWNKFGQCGLNPNNIRSRYLFQPQHLECFDKYKIADIKMAIYYTVFQMQNGSIYRTDKNINNGSIYKLNGIKNIKEIQTGHSHCLLLDINGNLFVFCDNNRFNQLGHDPSAYDDLKMLNDFDPRQIPYFKNKNIKICQMSCGDNHCLVLDTNGILYSWGDNQFKQCGLGIQDKTISTPQIIETLQNENIVQFDCSSHNLAISKDGIFYMWGSNWNGSCIINTDRRDISIPTAINNELSQTVDISKIYQISLGSFNTMILSFK
eukprot:418140_1